MIYPWKLNFWQSGEWQVCNERLKDLEKAGVVYNPARRDLFRALSSLPPEKVNVCIVGQDPYPDHRMATGYAFSIPKSYRREDFPRTLTEIYKEYTSDTGYPFPSHGDLSGWVSQGVLLWNAIPSVRAGQSMSHDWDEYSYLNREIFKRLSENGIVFAFLGGVARRYSQEVDPTNNEVIITSHPSPRGSRNSRTPFEGSRLFTTINAKLISQGRPAIDWRLSNDDTRPERERLGSESVGGNDNNGVLQKVLPNLTGSTCGPLYDARGVCIRE